MKMKLYYLKAKDGRFVRLNTGPGGKAYLVPAYRGVPFFSRVEFNTETLQKVQDDIGQATEIVTCEVEVTL